MRVGNLFIQSNAPPEESDDDGRATAGVGEAGSDESQARPQADTAPPDTAGNGVVGSARVYSAIDVPKQILSNSITYRLLTGRDEPKEIVLDLRKPAIVATSRRYSLQFYQTILGLSPTSGAAGISYRGWMRVREQPVRLVSIAVLAIALLVLVGEAASGSELGPSTLVWIGVFLLAARGTQKRHSLDEIPGIQWLQTRLTGQEETDEGVVSRTERDK
ncbi:hypothetical protein OB955_20035 [Halobacteria archaeon AArc-m2/3/4]|uniref:Uncharacterized protein n=1 Tax=Natronoglomus mannanivorans TaxID=2979990 RepID=A0ABT2QJE6_9EURY|nr:hypothetical protein [Halobacteria archaeon AArc-m2/3/4]